MKWGIRKRNEDTELSIDTFRKNIDRMFDDFFSIGPTSLFESEWVPKLDIEEDDDSIDVKAEIPGLDEKDINVTIENSMLTISGEKKYESKKEDKDRKLVVSERKFGSFSRTISLPDGIKADKVKAKFKKGVLNIHIPKDEKAKLKRIQIDVK